MHTTNIVSKKDTHLDGWRGREGSPTRVAEVEKYAQVRGGGGGGGRETEMVTHSP